MKFRFAKQNLNSFSSILPNPKNLIIQTREPVECFRQYSKTLIIWKVSWPFIYKMMHKDKITFNLV